MTDSKKIFLDTNPVIYYIEESPEYFEKVNRFLDTNAESAFITSTITIAEYFPHPIKENDTAAQEAFDSFIEGLEVDVIPINREIAYKAAEIRASFDYHIKPMDALQLATAVINGCDVFLTKDKQLRQFTETQVLTMDEIP